MELESVHEQGYREFRHAPEIPSCSFEHKVNISEDLGQTKPTKIKMYVLLYVLLDAKSCAFPFCMRVAPGRPTDLYIPPLYQLSVIDHHEG